MQTARELDKSKFTPCKVNMQSERLNKHYLEIQHQVREEIKGFGSLAGFIMTRMEHRNVEDIPQEYEDIVRTDDEISRVIVEVVCDVFNISDEEIRDRRRTQNKCIPRQIAMTLIRCAIKKSLKNIGVYLSNRGNRDVYDHSTVINGCRSVKDIWETANPVKPKLKLILNRLATDYNIRIIFGTHQWWKLLNHPHELTKKQKLYHRTKIKKRISVLSSKPSKSLFREDYQ